MSDQVKERLEVKISRWDMNEILETQEDINMYLEIAFESGDPKYILKALGNAARAQGMQDISKKTGLTREHMYNALSESGNPTFSTLTAIVDTMGYRLAIVPKDRQCQHQ